MRGTGQKILGEKLPLHSVCADEACGVSSECKWQRARLCTSKQIDVHCYQFNSCLRMYTLGWRHFLLSKGPR